MKISVIGAGYVGLTTAACLAQVGHDVFCSESDLEKLAKLQNGVMPLFEPHLEDVIKSGRKAGRLRFGSTEDAIAWGNAIFICVGTPPLANGDADLSAIEGVARAIAKQASGYRLVIEKSTVPVQTGAQLQKHLSVHRRNGLSYDVASNPEFLREGSSVEDFLHPDRIVIGADSQRAEDLLRQIYEPIIGQSFPCPIHSDCPNRKNPVFLATDTNSAELIKHASNSFLAMKISFINMVANLCEVVGADVTKVAQGMGLDPRIGPAFLNPGIGFGGFCFPKDVQAFIRIAEKSGCDFSLLREVEKINQGRVEHFVEKIRMELWVLRGKKIAVWGLAFKPNTDDIRFAPSIALLKALLAEGAVVQAYDPEATEKARAVFPEVTYFGDAYQAAEGADAILIVTEWDAFRQVDWKRLLSTVEQPLVIDGRNVFNPEEISLHGFRYVSIGRVEALPQSAIADEKMDPSSVQLDKNVPEVPGLIRKSSSSSLDNSICGCKAATPRSITFVVNVNDRQILQNNLLASPCFGGRQNHQILVQEGFISAAKAYNDAINRSVNDLMVFVHQDVLFPRSWLLQLEHSLEFLEVADPRWGVLGCWGATLESPGLGHIYSHGLGILGESFQYPKRVQTLDEVVLILRKSSGLRFDERLPYFHFYGADICMAAGKKEMKSYVIPAPCIHNTQFYPVLPREFYQCYRQFKRTWKGALPIQTSCIRVTGFDLPMYTRKLRECYIRYIRRYIRRKSIGASRAKAQGFHLLLEKVEPSQPTADTPSTTDNFVLRFQ